MAQGTIRKGFFFYFGLFALLLISIFLICLVVMMFNPGNTVLWMQYFTANETILVSKTTDDKTAIDLSSISTLEINCSYAKVTVEKNKNFSQDGIYIVNKAKGFTAASSAVEFGYTATFVGNTLKLDVTEPTGFLYFSKDIEIVVHAYSENNTNFSGLKLKVVDAEGDVQIGAVAPKETADVKLSSLSVETVKGNIDLYSNFDTTSLTALSLTSEEGKIQSFRKIAYGEGKTGSGVKVNCDASFKTNKGRISFDVVDVGANEIDIASKKGAVAIDYIKADITNVTCMQGNYKFGSIYGSLSYTNSEDSILAPNIMADYISGDFTLSTRSSADVEPDIDIKEIGGDVVVIADKGNLKVKKAHGAVDVSSENQLMIEIIVADDKPASKIVSIINNSGDTKVGFLGSMAGDIYLSSNSGKIIVNVTSVAKFTSTAYVNDVEGTTLLADKNISVNLGLAGNQTINPLTVAGTSAMTGNMTIKTNSNVSYNLVSVESLVA